MGQKNEKKETNMNEKLREIIKVIKRKCNWAIALLVLLNIEVGAGVVCGYYYMTQQPQQTQQKGTGEHEGHEHPDEGHEHPNSKIEETTKVVDTSKWRIIQIK